MSQIPNLHRVFRLPWRSAARVAADVDDELRFHVDMRARELERGGMPAHAARVRALEEFGDFDGTRHILREADMRHERAARRAERAEETWQDVRYAWRTLRRSPGFTAVAILTLALGIGANTAIFSIVYGVLMRPLPYAEQERLVRVLSTREGQRSTTSPPDYLDWRAMSRSFEGMAAFNDETRTLTGVGEPQRLTVARVGGDFFRLLRASPMRGRAITPDDDSPAAPRVAVLSESFWRSNFGSDPSVVGRVISLDGDPTTVIGVMPAGIAFPNAPALWLPMRLSPDEASPNNRGAHYIRVLARLAPHVTLERARSEMAAIAKRLEALYPAKDLGYGAEVLPVRELMVGDVRRPLLVLLGAVGFVLLIAGANVANLLLARAAGRETEIALRTALGAGRGRIVRQLVTESVLLSLAGAAVGVALAAWGVRLFVAFAPARIPRLAEVHLDGPVLAATAAVAVLVGLLFGLVPARQAARPDLARTLREGARAGRVRPESRRLRGALVVAELALAVMLLAGAGLLIRSFARLRAVDPGFRAPPARVVAFDLSLPDSRYEDDARRRAVVDEFVARLAAQPGTQAAGAAIGVPLSDASFSLSFAVRGRPAPTPGQEPSLQIRWMTPGYFAALGIPLLRGRMLTAQDGAGAPQVALLNQTAARRYFSGEDPLGKYIDLGWSKDKVRLGGEVVGVVGDTRQYGLDGEVPPEIYIPYDQWPLGDLTVVVRSTLPTSAVVGAAREQLRALDRDLPLTGVTTMERMVEQSVATPRFYMTLLGAFAGVALLLAAVGIYGVIAYAVTTRTHEIGIRMALGATAERVMRLVVGQGLAMAALGVALGIVGALTLTRLMRTLLFEVAPTDPATFAAVALALVLVATAACVIPAVRAARLDPVKAMRSE